jgi:ubiquinone/menaquinone biosynthesis C-methylase UbiE
MSRREWNRTADQFDELVCDIASEETNNQLRRFVSAARPSPKKSVLVDLGCGTGTFVQKFGTHFREIFAADFATAVVRKAEKTYRGATPARWHVADVKDCPKLFGDRVADLAVCLNVITSPSAARRKSLWTSIKAVTKPSGHMLVVVPSSESCEMVNEWENRARKKAKPAFRQGGIAERGDIWQKHFSRSELIETVTDLGFSVVRLGAVSYPWSSEGLRKPRSATKAPWDWICLAKRVG